MIDFLRASLIIRNVKILCMLALIAGCSKQVQPTGIPGASAERGRVAIERYGCVACHTIPGIRAPMSNVGPPLTSMGRRAYIAGVLPNLPDNMVRWLRNPPEVDPRTAMPNMHITEAEAKDMAAYLYTLN